MNDVALPELRQIYDPIAKAAAAPDTDRMHPLASRKPVRLGFF
ncbi:hypothetical protein [Acidisphaera sp. S103]|nr:hypothetical protein [Acidisphaera sp. S103]